MPCFLCNSEEGRFTRLKSGEQVHPKCVENLEQAIAKIRNEYEARKQELREEIKRLENRRSLLRAEIYSLEWKSNPNHLFNIFRSKEAIFQSQQEKQACSMKLPELDNEYARLSSQIEQPPPTEIEELEKKLQYIQSNIDNVSKSDLLFQFEKPFKLPKSRYSRKYKIEIKQESIWGQLREEAFKRYGRLCRICLSKENLQVHHVIELSIGGTNDISNLEVLCEECHEREHGRRFTYDDNDSDEYGENPTIRSRKTAEINEAIKNGKQINIKYVNGEGEESERIVSPEEIFTHRGRIYFRGYCHLRNERRTFRVSRIKSISAIRCVSS
ncbi:MAG: WYL domain-containing protein [Pseudomonadota bacterium]